MRSLSLILSTLDGLPESSNGWHAKESMADDVDNPLSHRVCQYRG